VPGCGTLAKNNAACAGIDFFKTGNYTMAFRMTSICIFLFLSARIFAQDKGEVLATFEAYKNAVVTNKLDQAIGLLDSATLAHHSRLLDNIKKADFKKADALPLYDKFMLLFWRSNADQASLLTLDRHRLLSGIIRSDFGIRLESIGEIIVTGNAATAVRIGNGVPTRYLHHFAKEKSGWKFSLRGSREVFEEVHRSDILKSGKTENEFLIEKIERQSGKKTSPNIWLPPKTWK
jgi:hypothetical protein